MVKTVEVLNPPHISRNGALILGAMIEAIQVSEGWSVRMTEEYKGKSDVLMLYGVGAPTQSDARKQQRDSGRRTVMWDMGYFGRRRANGYLRCSIDHEHPQADLDNTPPDPSRWNQYGIEIRNDYSIKGHILLVGMGPKAKVQHGDSVANWEGLKLRELRLRFPYHTVIFRPKPKRPFAELQAKTDGVSPIQDLLKKCYLVVCRHSNVAVDAVIAGVPIECEDGAAIWLDGKQYSDETRLSFLHRLAWWQWRHDEAKEAWNFLQGRL